LHILNVEDTQSLKRLQISIQEALQKKKKKKKKKKEALQKSKLVVKKKSIGRNGHSSGKAGCVPTVEKAHLV
jgi:hypothetical protein